MLRVHSIAMNTIFRPITTKYLGLLQLLITIIAI